MTDQIQRPILSPDSIAADIYSGIASFEQELIKEIEVLIQEHHVVLIGMGMAVSVKQAKRYLEQAGINYCYREFGSYLSGWKQRSALKLWSGWRTFPMVFVGGKLIGGASNLKALIKNGELT